MNMIFDLTEDEAPIFLAETNEQFQTLDDGLVRLEKGDRSEDLIQAVFRAAHTLKGSAGMIGHQRMVALTHTLETVLDGVRKQQVAVTPGLIDSCLEAIDGLRLLCNEVVSGVPAKLNLNGLVQRLSDLGQVSGEAAAPARVKGPAALPDRLSTTVGTLVVHACISPDSIAPSARAFQLMLALQEAGEIVQMVPTQAQIEASSPVSEFYAELIAKVPADEVYRLLSMISEVEAVSVEPHDEQASPAVEAKPKDAAQAGSGSSAAEGADPRRHTADKTVRTSVERLDVLMNLVGELITDRNRLYLLRSHLETAYRGDMQVETLSETITHVGRITDQLQAEVMGIRMLPISNVFNKYPRLVRDLARKADKQVNLIIRGEDTELDRSVIEVINDPLIHILRNSVDHGIESTANRLAAGKSERGTITLTARHEQGRIIITIEDDGAGIDIDRVKAKAVEKGLLTEKDAAALTPEEAVDFVFVSGLSTARTISDISGRGVGMDIVRNNIERLNGSVSVETWKGKGTLFQISLPLTLAIVPTLLVRVGNGTFAIPLVTVIETLRRQEGDLKSVNGRPVLLLRDHVLPVVRLADVFGIRSTANGGKYKYIVVVQSGKNQAGLIVDALVGEQEVVVKSLSAVVGEVTGISSAAILGDGQVALILDIQGILKIAAPR